jgi:hypothetical protein
VQNTFKLIVNLTQNLEVLQQFGCYSVAAKALVK